MKIAILGARNFPSQHGGLEVVVEDLTFALAALGHEVTVFVSESNVDYPAPLVRVQQVRSLRGKYTHTMTQMLSTLAGMTTRDFDVVHIHGVGPAFVLLARPLLRWRGATVVTAHGLDWERRKWPPIAAALFRKISVHSLRRADAVSAVSGSTASALESTLGAPVLVIPNGLSLPDLPSTIPVDLPPRFSVCVSRLTPEKNLERIVSAYSDEVADRLGPLVVVGGGRGSYADRYEADLRALPNDNVVWLGPLPRNVALSVVRESIVFVSMSKTEAQPMAVLEARTLGVPLLLSDISAHREIGGADATYADPDSTADVRSALLLVAERVGQDPPRPSAPPPSWAETAARYQEWYSSVNAPR